MTDDSKDTFEIEAAAGLKKVGGADPLVVERVVRTIGDLPDRRRRPSSPSPFGGRWLGGLAVAIAAVVVVAMTLQILGLRPAGPLGPTIGPGPVTRPTTVVTESPSPTIDLSPSQFASDPRMLACEQVGHRTLADVMYAFELAHGKDYRSNLQIPVVPSLASAEQPALFVLFKTGDSTSSSGGDPPLIFTPSPGERSVCVGLTGIANPVYITNVEPAEIVLPPAAAPAGPIASVYADTKRPLSAMAWDETRQSLWVVTWNTGPNGELTRVGLNGSTQSWSLPNGPDLQIQPKIQAGLDQGTQPAARYDWTATDIVVDGEGVVWIAAGYGLVRFDPATGKSRLKVFPEPDLTKLYVLDGGSWMSAIAADGDGVLVARNGNRQLTRVNESLAEAGTINLPLGLGRPAWTCGPRRPHPGRRTAQPRPRRI